MNLYSISDLQKLSGIKAHTIRIWEQRYQALQPIRSKGNTRYYDDTQLRRLLNIVSLSGKGMKISELCLKSDQEIEALIDRFFIDNNVKETSEDYFISQLIAAGIDYDEVVFEKLFSIAVVKYGLKSAYLEVIYPMLVRIGLLWGKNSITPAQEHFISSLVRQKIISACDELQAPTRSHQKWLLFLPANEHHEIGLLLSNYLLRTAGIKVVYLGANVPLESVKSSIDSIQPTHLLFFMTHYNSAEAGNKYIREFSKIISNQSVFLSGNTKLLQSISLPKNIKWIKQLNDLEQLIG